MAKLLIPTLQIIVFIKASNGRICQKNYPLPTCAIKDLFQGLQNFSHFTLVLLLLP